MGSCEVGESKKKQVEEDSQDGIYSCPSIPFKKGYETYQTILLIFFHMIYL